MTGWNLPPGCNIWDIPGNRPQDVAWERMWETLTEEDFHKLHEEDPECVCGNNWENAGDCPLAEAEINRRLEAEDEDYWCEVERVHDGYKDEGLGPNGQER